jgi:1-acyl-sn-glycerol-3-phosphate acyltransferase
MTEKKKVEHRENQRETPAKGWRHLLEVAQQTALLVGATALGEIALTRDEKKRVENALQHLNSAGIDPWGADPKTVARAVNACHWLYRKYFRVEVAGIENVPQGRCLLIANHAGQIPLDGIMIGLSMMLEATPPRLVRGMIERWAPALPFVSTFFSRSGQLVGDHRNCRDLLEHEECVLVFPEGAEGSGKTFQHAYELQDFGTGFIRLALETRTPVVPVAVIGSEETFPSFYNAKFIAKLFKAPYFPVTPTFPALGPLGAIPLPTKITLLYGEPIKFDADPDAPDAEVDKLVAQVKATLHRQMQEGLKKRDGHIFRGSGV